MDEHLQDACLPGSKHTSTCQPGMQSLSRHWLSPSTCQCCCSPRRLHADARRAVPGRRYAIRESIEKDIEKERVKTENPDGMEEDAPDPVPSNHAARTSRRP